jgi:hypothetical protein
VPRIDAHDETHGPRARAGAHPAPASRLSVKSGFWVGAALLVAVRPRLWAVAVRQARRLARPRWWARPPFLPIPDRDYLGFRFETQYGSGEPSARDLIAYLEWCRAMDRDLDGRAD